MNLKIKQVATLYSVRESEVIEEHDSPAIGARQVIFNRVKEYIFFTSLDTANQFIDSRRDEYIKKENLHLMSNNGYYLSGTTNHPFAHEYYVIHSIKSKDVLIDDLPENLEQLLANPECNLKEEWSKKKIWW